MKYLVFLPLLMCLVHADSSEKQDVKLKPTPATLNTLPHQPQKYETIYQPMKYHQLIQQQPQPQQIPFQYQQQKPQYVPVQIIPRYLPQPQPQAMIIIAQPALVPSSLVYGNPTQQLLNYFHNNPQAKYQLLHGNYQQPQPQPQQPTYMHPVVASPSIGNYIITAAPAQPYQQYQQQPAPTNLPSYSHPVAIQAPSAPVIAQYSTHQQQQQQQQQQPTQLTSIAHLAQLAAQQYASSPMKSTPAIVTGFENFTPEQQAQIKAQLNSHLGTNYHAVSNGAPQYSSKYNSEQESNDFVPSPQVKSEVPTTMSTGGDILKTQYSTKG